MSRQPAFGRALAAIHEAMLDDARWPAAAGRIDEACGTSGSELFVTEGPRDAPRILFVGMYRRGLHREDLERIYVEDYYRDDESIPRLAAGPYGRLIHARDLYTAEELKSSAAWNEALSLGGCQDGLRARLGGPDGTRIAWSLADPADADGWGAARVTMVNRLLPHIGQFVSVRQALVRAEARSATLTSLLDNPRVGVVHLDRRGRVLEVNDRARDILRNGDGLSDRYGRLRARTPADKVRLDELLASALPASAVPAVGGWMLLRRSSVLPRFVVHVKPVDVPRPDYGARRVAALMLIVEPGRRHRIDPEVVATTLELTPGETQVAVWLAEGKGVREMAEATGRTEGAIYRHLKQIYQKQSISRQADLVRLVLSLAE
ncbi:MAG: helix-turn-helix transcriptional regulator [Holophagales bacterium]|nr:helix-turn-helix transcriptional regulator [Holophagales bacterium]MYD23419.1 helix-turn-helix transcriptional regulator [Holophagales bacterium]MYI33594.1 helix-turn-helix transcriptional regulator [Holophagales bacterium]